MPDGSAATRAPAAVVVADRVLAALCQLGFRRGQAVAAIARIAGDEPDLGVEQLLRQSLTVLVPAPAEAVSRMAEAAA